MAMIDTVLNFNGSATPNKGPDWFDRDFWDMQRLPGQLMGLGAGCPEIPSSPPSTAILSSPSCGNDPACINLAGQIQQYNTALKIKAAADWNRLICEHNKCLNQDNTDCLSRFPAVYVPPRPNAPNEVALQWDNGFVTGYARPADTAPAAGMSDSQEVASARQSLISAMSQLGVGGNQSLLAKMETEFTKGLSWWLSQHANYSGLAAHTAANAVATVRQWIRDLGITAPPPVTGGDGTPKVPSSSGSGQGGNTDTPATGGKDPLPSASFSFSLSNPLVLAGLAVAGFMLMQKGGR